MEAASPKMAAEKEEDTRITVTFPADLYHEIKRISASENWPESQAVVLLARLGVKSQKRMETELHSAYEAFLAERDPKKQDQLGDELICSIFGPDAIG